MIFGWCFFWNLDENGSQNGQIEITGCSQNRYFSRPFPKIDSFTLRACPPTRLHAPYLHAPRYSRSVLASAMRMLTPWDPGLGTQDPRKGPRSQGPRGARGPFGPPGQGRLRRPWGPWGPLGLFRGYSEWVLFCGKLLWGCICKVRSKQPIWK